MTSFALLLIVFVTFLPPVIGYTRGLGHWSMTRIWLLLLLPVAGWVVALYEAMTQAE